MASDKKLNPYYQYFSLLELFSKKKKKVLHPIFTEIPRK
jgi:hypothetical protein